MLPGNVWCKAINIRVREEFRHGNQFCICANVKKYQLRNFTAHGFFVRDMSDIQTAYQIESAIKLAQLGYLFRTFKHATLEMQDFSSTGSRSGTTLVSGDTRLLRGSSIYGWGHMLLQPNAVTSRFKMNFSTEQLKSIHEDAQSTFENDIHALFTIFEWSAASIEGQQPISPLLMRSNYQFRKPTKTAPFLLDFYCLKDKNSFSGFQIG